jgi:hypothetical protein
MDLQSQQFLPLQCDLIAIDNQIRVLREDRDEARRRTAAPGTDEEL